MSVDSAARGLAAKALPKSGGAITGPITGTGATVTANAPVLDLSQSWNNAAVAFTGLRLNVGDSGSTSASKLVDLQIGGNSVLQIRKDGSLYGMDVGGGAARWSIRAAASGNGPAMYNTYGNLAWAFDESSGVGQFSLSNGSYYSWANNDLGIYRDAANTYGFRNGANGQTARFYNTFTDGSNYERGGVRWTGNRLEVFAEAGGTGTSRDLRLVTGGGSLQMLTNGNIVNASGPFLFQSDNTYDIGAAGATRPRAVYVGGFYASAISAQSGAAYTVAGSDSSLIFTNAATVTLTLPAASSFTGRKLHLKATGGGAVNSAGSNVVPLAGGSAGTAILAASAGKWAELQSDGTNWVVMAGN